jgi:5'-3' exonuclease
MSMYFASVVQIVRPKYMAVAFDAGKLTFRNTLFPNYKQHRTQVHTKHILIPVAYIAHAADNPSLMMML